MRAHVHECFKSDPDHTVCQCECGASAWNTMGAPEWDNTPKSFTAKRSDDDMVTRQRFNEVAAKWIPEDVADAIEEELFGSRTKLSEYVAPNEDQK